MAQKVELCPGCKGDVTGILSPFCSSCGTRLSSNEINGKAKSLLPLCQVLVAFASIVSLMICTALIVGTDSSVNRPGFVGPNFGGAGFVSVLGFYFIQIPATLVGCSAGIGCLIMKSRDWFCVIGLAMLVLAMIGSGFSYASFV